MAIISIEVVTAWTTGSLIGQKLAPASLQITEIVSSNCKECSSVDTAFAVIQDYPGVKVQSTDQIDSSSDKAKQLISQYKITRVPSIIVLGEFEKYPSLDTLWDQLGGVKNNNAIIVNTEPPYLDLSTNSVKGLVTLTKIVDSSCTKCASMDPVINAFKQIGVRIKDEKTVDFSSQEAKSLISGFSIQRIPAIVVSSDILEYRSVQRFWSQLNATLRQGFYALHSTTPPWINTVTNKIEGLVTLITLTDNSCSTCYNVSLHKQILARFGVKPEEMIYDISSDKGKEYTSSYKITKAPTILLSPDASFYSSLVQAWAQVGTKETDGWLIFRSVEVMGTYKDLTTNSIVNPQTS